MGKLLCRLRTVGDAVIYLGNLTIALGAIGGAVYLGYQSVTGQWGALVVLLQAVASLFGSH